MWGFNSTFAFLVSSFGYFYTHDQNIVVNTTYGELKGTTSESRSGRTIYEFLGIPYAKAPVGDLRFKSPMPPETWNDTRDATSYGDGCVQIHLISRLVLGDEDCLFLNVYTHQFQKKNEPQLAEEKLKPVMIFFHGGIFIFGLSNVYLPKYYLDEDVILVTPNYRLGALGFLNMGNDDIRGNMGLKDQVMSLKWIQENIRNFGGDPNKVTIMGESAGAASVHLHMLSPMSKGLFHRAISQSGTAFAYWAMGYKPLEQADRFVQRLNCSSESPKLVMECLRNISSRDIVETHRELTYFEHPSVALFGPSVECGIPPDAETFLPESPMKIIKDGNSAEVPWISGVNSEDGLILAAPMMKNESLRDQLNGNWNKWIPMIFQFEDDPEKEVKADKIREYFLGSREANISMELLQNFTMFLSDRAFFEGLHNAAVLHAKYSKAPVYPYLYSYKGVFSLARVSFDMNWSLPAVMDIFLSSGWNWVSKNVFGVEKTHLGTCHADEMALQYNLPMQPIHKKGSKFGLDYEMSDNLIQIWTTFARDGVPPIVQNITWPPVNICLNSTDAEEEKLQFLRLDRTIELVDEPFGTRVNFWKSLNLKPYYNQEEL